MSFYELAVLGKSTFAISPICENHTVFLQPIQITATDFEKLFFTQNTFCVSTAYTTIALVSFARQFISNATTGFYPTTLQELDLYECIYQYALYDLNLPTCNISPIAQLELRNELQHLTLNSLDIISGTRYTTIKDFLVDGNTFTISVVFSNKNSCIKPVIIKFPYVIGTTVNPPVSLRILTILVYNTDHGPTIVWNGVTFIKYTYLQNFSYTSSITSIPVIQAPFNTDLKEFKIGNLFESIPPNIFYGYSFTSITIPDSVISIGQSSFEGSNLTSVTIPNSVTIIGQEAFESCLNLRSVTISNSLEIIPLAMFRFCSNLESVIIPNSVKIIRFGAFSACSNLSSVIIPNSVETIEYRVFHQCYNLTSITIPNSVISIVNDAFEDSGLITVTIANDNPLGIPSPGTNVPFFGETVETILPS